MNLNVLLSSPYPTGLTVGDCHFYRSIVIRLTEVHLADLKGERNFTHDFGSKASGFIIALPNEILSGNNTYGLAANDKLIKSSWTTLNLLKYRRQYHNHASI